MDVLLSRPFVLVFLRFSFSKVLWRSRPWGVISKSRPHRTRFPLQLFLLSCWTQLFSFQIIWDWGYETACGYMGYSNGDSEELAAATYVVHAILSWVNGCGVLVLSLKLKKCLSRGLLCNQPLITQTSAVGINGIYKELICDSFLFPASDTLNPFFVAVTILEKVD